MLTEVLSFCLVKNHREWYYSVSRKSTFCSCTKCNDFQWIAFYSSAKFSTFESDYSMLISEASLMGWYEARRTRIETHIFRLLLRLQESCCALRIPSWMLTFQSDEKSIVILVLNTVVCRFSIWISSNQSFWTFLGSDFKGKAWQYITRLLTEAVENFHLICKTFLSEYFHFKNCCCAEASAFHLSSFASTRWPGIAIGFDSFIISFIR